MDQSITALAHIIKHVLAYFTDDEDTFRPDYLLL